MTREQQIEYMAKKYKVSTTSRGLAFWTSFVVALCSLSFLGISALEQNSNVVTPAYAACATIRLDSAAR